MGTVIDVLVSILVLFVFVWMAIFGGTGALLARSRGGSSLAGAAWGALLGPFGWVGIWLTTRAGRREVTAAEWTEGLELDDDWAASLVAPQRSGDA